MMPSSAKLPRLEFMAQAHKELLFLQITDTHLHATRDSRMRGVNTYTSLSQVMDYVRKSPHWPPDGVLATGDLVQDESRAGYELFAAVVGAAKVPIYCIPGNHDDPRLMAEVLAKPNFHVGGTHSSGGWCWIMLSSFEHGQDAGRLEQSELERLAEALTAHPNHSVLVCLHHQPIPMGSAWLDGVGLRNADEFGQIVSRHSNVAGVVWGHVHQASDRERDGVRYLSAPSTGSQFLPDSPHFAIDEKPPGCRWIRLGKSGEIETWIDWLEQ